MQCPRTCRLLVRTYTTRTEPPHVQLNGAVNFLSTLPVRENNEDSAERAAENKPFLGVNHAGRFSKAGALRTVNRWRLLLFARPGFRSCLISLEAGGADVRPLSISKSISGIGRLFADWHKAD